MTIGDILRKVQEKISPDDPESVTFEEMQDFEVISFPKCNFPNEINDVWIYNITSVGLNDYEGKPTIFLLDESPGM